MKFEVAIKAILEAEGGYVNDPADSGGKTKFGISDAGDGKKDGKADIDGDGTGDVKVEALTLEQAKTAYLKRYWHPLNCEPLKDDLLVLHLFDMAVNAGRVAAVLMLQQLLGVRADGRIGPVTIAAANNFDGSLAERYIDARIERYKLIAKKYPKNKKFIKGWLKRVNDITAYYSAL